MACIAVATAGTPVAAAAEDPAQQREASRTWNPFFAEERPVPTTDPRHVIVTFEDPSLGEWSAAGERELTAVQRRLWVKKALVVQQKRLDALALGGVQFRIQHRYVRVMNGASLLVHGDGAQLLRAMPAVASVVPVRPLWPTATTSSATSTATADDDGAAGAAAAAGSAPVDAAKVRVGVLDTAVDATHPAIAGNVAKPLDATAQLDEATEPQMRPDAHGTAVAGAVLRGAGDQADVEIVPVQVLQSQPARDGVEAVFGESDDLIAALELVVDPNGDGNNADALDVAVVAATTPFAGFAESPEDRAVRGADALGTVVVAAAGNDGASGDDVGTVGSVSSSTSALAVGAADLRGRTPAADVRLRGDGIDQTFSGAAVLTTSGRALPEGELRTVAVEGGGEVVDYLDAELQSRVAGAVALVATRPGVTVAEQVRAAADAGAIAVLVGSDGADAAAGTIDVPGADIPAIALDRADARALRDALAAGTRLHLTLTAETEPNPLYGTVAGFSAAGPRLDGLARPDALAPGVGMIVAGPGSTWRVASGTSIAAAWAAGQAASVRAAHPDWDSATVRAALLGTAIPLGTADNRPAVRLQGAGVLDAEGAAGTRWVAGTGRIDFGSVAPGSAARRSLDLGALAGAATVEGATVLLDDGGSDTVVTPTLDGDQLLLQVAAGAPNGHVGGWLVLPAHDIRIPWSATVRDAATMKAPVTSSVTNKTLKPVAGPGAFASTLTIAIGGDAGDDRLGLAAVERLDVRLVDALGRDHGSVGGLDQALPGIYSFGVSGVDTKGEQLKSGTWTLKVRYVPATDPTGTWRAGPAVEVTVPRPE